jgi:AcrR family transcriptional regulator
VTSEHLAGNVQNASPVGRPASATRQQALERAESWVRAGRRIEVQALARELGVGRTTLYSWFGSRDALVSEAFAQAAHATVSTIRADVPGRGATAILETLARYNRVLVGNPMIARSLRADPAATVRLVTDPDGALHRAHLAIVEQLISDEVDAGAYRPPIAIATLAYALVVLGQYTIFIEAQNLHPDLERLAMVQAHLLAETG